MTTEAVVLRNVRYHFSYKSLLVLLLLLDAFFRLCLSHFLRYPYPFLSIAQVSLALPYIAAMPIVRSN